MPRKRSLEISVGPVSVHNAVACLDEGVKREHSGKQQTQSRSANTLPKSLSGTIGHFRITFSLFLKASLGAHPFI